MKKHILKENRLLKKFMQPFSPLSRKDEYCFILIFAKK